MSNLIDSLLNMLNASIVSSHGILIIAIDVEIGSIRPNVVAKLAVCEFWHLRSAISSWKKERDVPHGVPTGQGH